MVFQLAYLSTASVPWSRAELSGLLGQARRSNAEQGVTGALLYRNGRFLQLLEGERGTVRDLYGRIAGDPRHRDVVTVLERRRLVRQFTGWSMAFRDLGAEPIGVAGFDGVLDRAAEEPFGAATGALVARLRLVAPAGRLGVHTSRVLGPIGAEAVAVPA